MKSIQEQENLAAEAGLKETAQRTIAKTLYFPLRKPATPPPETEQAVSVAVVYEDEATRKWARETYEQMFMGVGCDEVQCTWWKLEGLSEPAVLAGAVSKAMRADVIIVAVQASEGFPLPFYVWVSSWLPHRMHGEGKLVALVATPKLPEFRRNRAAEYLRAVAERARMDFEVTERNLALEVPSAFKEPNGRKRAMALSPRHRSPNVVQLFPLRRWRMAA